jgi:hypothetical protein
MDYYSNERRNVTILKAKYDAGLLKAFATVKFNEPKLKGINIIDMKLIYRNKEYILGEYEVKYRVDRGKWRECKNHWDTSVHRYGSYNNAPKDTYIFTERVGGHKKDYVKSICPTGWNEQTIIVKKNKPFKLGSTVRSADYTTYVSVLGLNKIGRHLWRAAIKEFHSIVDMYKKDWKDLDALVVPQEFIDSKKKIKVKVGAVPGQRRQKLKGEITGKEASPLERDVYGQNSKFVPAVYQLENAHKLPYLHVYGSQNDKTKLDHLFGAFRKCRKDIRFIMFSERELANLEKIELHNWIKIDKFMEGINKPFKRIVTAHLIAKLIEKYKPVFRKKENMEGVSKDLHDKIETLYQYENAYNPGYMSGDTEAIIFGNLLEIAEANNLFDGEIYPIYQEVKAILDKFPFIKSVFDVMNNFGNNAPLEQVVVDLLKYNKHKVNLDRYNVKLTEDAPLEEELTEATIEVLQD